MADLIKNPVVHSLFVEPGRVFYPIEAMEPIRHLAPWRRATAR